MPCIKHKMKSNKRCIVANFVIQSYCVVIHTQSEKKAMFECWHERRWSDMSLASLNGRKEGNVRQKKHQQQPCDIVYFTLRSIRIKCSCSIVALKLLDSFHFRLEFEVRSFSSDRTLTFFPSSFIQGKIRFWFESNMFSNLPIHTHELWWIHREKNRIHFLVCVTFVARRKTFLKKLIWNYIRFYNCTIFIESHHTWTLFEFVFIISLASLVRSNVVTFSAFIRTFSFDIHRVDIWITITKYHGTYQFLSFGFFPTCSANFSQNCSSSLGFFASILALLSFFRFLVPSFRYQETNVNVVYG